MRVICTSLLLSAVSLAGVGRWSASGQTRNPKPPFTLTISVNPHDLFQDDTGDKAVRPASSVMVRVRKTNISDHSVPKLGSENGPFGYIFDVRDSNGNPAPPHKPTSQWQTGGGPMVVPGTKDDVLQSGESKIDYAPLSEWYDLSSPGT